MREGEIKVDYPRPWQVVKYGSNIVRIITTGMSAKNPDPPRRMNAFVSYRCNLDCWFCPRKLSPEKGSMMSYATFKACLDNSPTINYVVFTGLGEPLLNKDLERMVVYANNRGCETWIITNGHFLEINSCWLDIVDHINISVDNGHLDQGKGRIVNWDRIKPGLVWITKKKISCHITQVNELDSKIQKEIRDLGVSIVKVDSIHDKNLPYNPNMRGRCLQPWRELSIRASGKVQLCCAMRAHYFDTVGDLSKEPLNVIWNNESFSALRWWITTRTENKLCGPCPLFRR